MMFLHSVKVAIISGWQSLPDWLRRIAHTFWQTFLATFLLGFYDIISKLLETGNLETAKTALLALATASLAAGFSALKAAIKGHMRA